MNNRLMAASVLKNYIQDYWHDDTEASILCPHRVMTNDTKAIFKENIINLMISSDQKILPVLKETIVTICKTGGGFSHSWPELMNVNYLLLIY